MPFCREVAMITRIIDGCMEKDEELVTKAKAGDQEAFVELCDRYRIVLKRRIQRIVQNHHDAEDILQDSILRAFTNLAGFRESCTFQTWITRIAINRSLMHLRGKHRLHFYASLDLLTTNGERIGSWDVPDPSPDPEQNYVANQASIMLNHAVEKLSPVFRQLVKQYHQHENKLIDAAKALGITVPAAKARLLRARRLLRRRLTNDQLRKPLSR
jgi:RNA polymerase sigma-70 factor (ECF subfamily)